MSTAKRKVLAELKAKLKRLESYGPESTICGYAEQARREVEEAKFVEEIKAEITKLEAEIESQA